MILLSINYYPLLNEIFSCFDDNYEIRGVFLDISKVSDEVRHEEIIPKLKHNGISGNLLSTLTDFLRNRNERVILNCQSSFQANNNYLSYNLQCNLTLFADDTSLLSTFKVPERTANNLNKQRKTSKCWPFQWRMNFNSDTTKQAQEIIFSKKGY